MLHITLPVKEPVPHFIDPIPEQLVRYLLERIDMLERFDRKISLASEHQAPTQTTDNKGNVFLSTRDEVRCVARVNLNPASAVWELPYNSIGGGTWPGWRTYGKFPIWIDPQMPATMTMHSQLTVFTLEITFRSRKLSTTLEVQDRIHQIFRQGEMYFDPDIAFNYQVPSDMLGIILGLMKLRGLNGNELVPLLRAGSDGIINVGVSREDQTRKEVIVTQPTQKLLCQLTGGDEGPEVLKSGQQIESTSITYTVSTQFARPAAISLDYPITIRNQIVPGSLVFADPVKAKKKQQSVSPFVQMEVFNRATALSPTRDDLYVNFPWYDEWVPPADASCRVCDFIPVISRVFLLDDLDNPAGVTTIDLGQFPDYPLKDELVQAITTLGEQAFYFENSINVAVFYGHIQVEPTTMTLVDGVLTLPNRHIDHPYRLVISIPRRILQHGTDYALRVLIGDIIARR